MFACVQAENNVHPNLRRFVPGRHHHLAVYGQPAAARTRAAIL